MVYIFDHSKKDEFHQYRFEEFMQLLHIKMERCYSVCADRKKIITTHACHVNYSWSEKMFGL